MKLCIGKDCITISQNETDGKIKLFKEIAEDCNLTVGNYVAIGKPEDLFKLIFELSLYYNLEIV